MDGSRVWPKLSWRALGLAVVAVALVIVQDVAVVSRASPTAISKETLLCLEIFGGLLAWPVIERIRAARAWLYQHATFTWVVLLVVTVTLRDGIRSSLPLVPPQASLLLFGFCCVGIVIALVRTLAPSTRTHVLAAVAIVVQAGVATAGLLLNGDRLGAAIMLAGGLFGAAVITVRMRRRSGTLRAGDERVRVASRRVTRMRSTAE
jgi:hypothetical protein